MNRLLLHAPSVHTGGGLVLLKDLLRVPHLPLAWFSVDARAVKQLEIPAATKIRIVQRSVVDRLRVEFDLRSQAREGDVVVCFHGMPPLLRSAARVIVFLQNRNYLGVNALSDFSGWTMVRIAFERLICRTCRGNVDEYLVQTPTMARLVASWRKDSAQIRIAPFLDLAVIAASRNSPRFDFLYVADGEAHKNHRVLLDAWILLAREGIRPSLALTLGPRDRRLVETFELAQKQEGLILENLGEIDRAEILQQYARSRALIYPSTSESFAIPLIEASALGVPILAPELDYVRDVASPVHTFDPTSPVSMARAVKRFLGIAEPPLKISTPGEFADLLVRLIKRNLF